MVTMCLGEYILVMFFIWLIVGFILGMMLIVPDVSEKTKVIIWCAIMLVVFPIGAYVIYDGEPQPYDKTTYIETLDDNMGIYGTFVLGSGTISSEPVYTFYQEGSNGGLYLGTIPATGTPIFRDTESEPYIKSHTCPCCNTYKTTSYEIHVPNNTVIRHYTLDGKL